MAKVRASIYVDRKVWERFRAYAARRGVDANRLLEELMMDEVVDLVLDEVLLRAAGGEEEEVLDFEPVEPRGSVSELVRIARDERARSISG